MYILKYFQNNIEYYMYILYNENTISILFCFVFMVMSLSAMNYQIKVLNTPTITINGKELKVGDRFDDQAIITWSKESQAMRVLSDDNRVYTLSAKLCKEIKAKKFSFSCMGSYYNKSNKFKYVELTIL